MEVTNKFYEHLKEIMRVLYRFNFKLTMLHKNGGGFLPLFRILLLHRYEKVLVIVHKSVNKHSKKLFTKGVQVMTYYEGVSNNGTC